MEKNITRRLILHDEDRPTVKFIYGDNIGKAMTYLHESTSRLHIDDIEVAAEARRNGIAKALLRSVKNLAEQIEAEEISARIISRESYDAMASVFGAESLHVRLLGSYENESPRNHLKTSASLKYRVGPTVHIGDA